MHFSWPLDKRRLEQIGCVERAAGSRTGTDDGVDLVDEQDAVRIVLQLLQHRLQALLEVAAIFGAGQQGAHVERINHRILQNFRHFALRHAPCQALGNRGLAHACLAHQQRVVLAATAQSLDHAIDFGFPSDQRVDLAFGSELVQVLRELIERAFLLLPFSRALRPRLPATSADRIADPCGHRAK